MEKMTAYSKDVAADLQRAITRTKARLVLQNKRLAALRKGEIKYEGSVCRNKHKNGVRFAISDCCVDCAPMYRKRKHHA